VQSYVTAMLNICAYFIEIVVFDMSTVIFHNTFKTMKHRHLYFTINGSKILKQRLNIAIVFLPFGDYHGTVFSNSTVLNFCPR